MASNVKLLFLIVISGLTSTSIASATEPVELERPYVAIADVLDMRATSATAQAVLERPLFTLSDGEVVSLSPTEIEAALLQRIPGLSGRLREIGEGQVKHFVYHATQPIGLDKKTCLELRHKVAADQAIRRRDTVSSDDCRSENVPGWRYDASTKSLSNPVDLPAGTRLPIRTGDVLPDHLAGDTLTLISTVGSVRVSRPVSLVETGQSGDKVHVLTGDGQVLSVQTSARQKTVAPAREDNGDPS